jgi:hypothetical protein
MPEVGQELKLSERQQQALNELRAATRQELQGIMATADPQLLQLLDPDQRELFFAEMRKKAEATNRTADEKLARLLDADQNQRLAQLRLQHVRQIATDWLDWSKLEPLVRQYETLIDKAIEADTRKLSSYAEFKQALSAERTPAAGAPRGPRPGMALRTFVEQRRQYLLDHEEIKKLPPAEGK